MHRQFIDCGRATFGNEIRFAAVDDNLNAVNVWTFDPKIVAPK